VTRPQALLLRAFAVWTVWVWSVRLWNIVRDPEHETGFKVVHSLLGIGSIAFAVAAWIVVRRVRAAASALPAGDVERDAPRQPVGR